MSDCPMLFTPKDRRSNPQSELFGTTRLAPFIVVRTGAADRLRADLESAGYQCRVDHDLYAVPGDREGRSFIVLEPTVDQDRVAELLSDWRS